jgi:hypothetical protein
MISFEIDNNSLTFYGESTLKAPNDGRPSSLSLSQWLAYADLISNNFPQSKNALNSIYREIIYTEVANKWRADKKLLPLNSDDFELYWWIHYFHYTILGKFPNLTNPKTYNDKVQWQKLFSQSIQTVNCTNKITLKNYVENKLGLNFTPNILWRNESDFHLNIVNLPDNFVLKTNHDSGSVFILSRDDFAAIDSAFHKSSTALSRVYGWEYGEWTYSFISPEIFIEEYIGDPTNLANPPDFKFHCSNGNILFLQYIYDRKHDVKEVILDKKGDLMRIHFDTNMKYSDNFKKPKNWHDMIEMCSVLSRDFNYVRIDLYSIKNKIYVGEMTFFPMAGTYTGRGQEQIGEILNISLDPNPPFITRELNAKIRNI